MLQNGILAVVLAESGDSQEVIRDSSVIGFLFVSEVDDKRRKLKVLAPMSGRIHRKAMIWGSWPEVGGNLVG